MRHAILNQHVAAAELELGEARRLQRHLDIHAVIHHVADELRVRRSLVEAAHDAEPDVHVALLHEGGNDGVVGPLARRERIRVRRVQFEQPAAILQREAVIVHHHARPEVLVHALNQRRDVALAIHHGEVDGIAGHGLGLSGRFVAARVIGVDQLGALAARRPARSGLRPAPC